MLAARTTSFSSWTPASESTTEPAKSFEPVSDWDSSILLLICPRSCERCSRLVVSMVLPSFPASCYHLPRRPERHVLGQDLVGVRTQGRLNPPLLPDQEMGLILEPETASLIMGNRRRAVLLAHFTAASSSVEAKEICSADEQRRSLAARAGKSTEDSRYPWSV